MACGGDYLITLKVNGTRAYAKVRDRFAANALAPVARLLPLLDAFDDGQARLVQPPMLS
jgi:hypothetical protein